MSVCWGFDEKASRLWTSTNLDFGMILSSYLVLLLISLKGLIIILMEIPYLYITPFSNKHETLFAFSTIFFLPSNQFLHSNKSLFFISTHISFIPNIYIEYCMDHIVGWLESGNITHGFYPFTFFPQTKNLYLSTDLIGYFRSFYQSRLTHLIKLYLLAT